MMLFLKIIFCSVAEPRHFDADQALASFLSLNSEKLEKIYILMRLRL
jgi:hypothetical protein